MRLRLILGDANAIDAIKIMDHRSKWDAIISTNGSFVSYKLDTGAETNVLPKDIYNGSKEKPKLLSTKVSLSAYNNTEIPVVGKCIVTVEVKQRRTPVMFVVADINSTAILDQSACEKLQLIRRIYKITGNLTDNNNNEKLLRTSVSVIDEVHSAGSVGELRKRIIKQYEKCFGDLGTLPGEYHIAIDKKYPSSDSCCLKDSLCCTS